MGNPAAKFGDQILATDTHTVLVPSPPGAPVPTPVSLPFKGTINGSLSSNVFITGQPAAVAGSTAANDPKHLPPPGTTFAFPPTDLGIILSGSATVFINGKPAARSGDPAQTCADPMPNLTGKVAAACTVLIGG